MTKAAYQVVRSQRGELLLAPLDDDGREQLAALKPDKPVMVHIHAARNPGHHRMLFAVFKLLQDAGCWDGDMDSLLDWMKYATGYVRTSVDHNGKLHHIPKSIAFESMPQDVFKRWFDRVLYIVCQRLLETEDWQAVRDAVLDVVHGETERRFKEANPHV